MADAARRSSANTELFIGTFNMAVGLYGTQAKPEKTQEFDTAGPNGGRLKYARRAAAAPVSDEVTDLPDQGVTGDPFGEQLAAATAAAAAEPAPVEPAASAPVEGEFQQYLVEEGTGKEVRPEEVRRGVRLEDGRFVDCTMQLAAIVERTKLDRIDAVVSIDSTQIRRERVIGAYYLGGQDAESIEKMRVLYESLRDRREVVVVKYTTRSRQQLGIVAPNAKTGTLILQSLVFAEDWREPPAKAVAIQKVAVDRSHVEMMSQLLGALHGRVDDLDEQGDDAVRLRAELRARALAGEMTAEVVEPLPELEEMPSLEEALKASVDFVAAGK